MQLSRFRSLFHPRRPWLWLALLLLAYALAGFFALPRLIERQLVSTSEDRLALQTRVEQVAFNPFTFVLRMDALDVREAGGAPLLALETLFVNFELASLLRWAWAFDEVHLIGLVARVERFSDGATNLARLAERWRETAPADQDPAPAPADGGLPRLVVADLRLQQGGLQFVDHVPTTPFETQFGPVDLAVANLSTLPDATGNQEVLIATEDGGEVRWSGRFDLDPIRAVGRLAVTGSHLPLVYRYLQDRLAFEVPHGDLDAQLDYRLAMRPDGEIEAGITNLTLTVTDLQVRDPALDETVLGLPRLHVAGGSVAWPEARVRLEEVRIAGASLLARRDADGVLNLVRLGGGQATAAEAAPPASAAPDSGWALSAGAVVLEDWQLTVEDAQPAAAVRIDADLDASVTGLSNEPDARSTVDARLALADDGGVLTVAGGATLAPELLAELDLTLDGLAVQLAQPYLSEAIRARIDEGVLHAAGTLSIGPDEPAGFAGGLSLNSLVMSDADRDQRLLAWQRLGVQSVRWSTSKRQLDVAEVVLDAPYLRVEIAPDGSTNIGDLLVEGAPPSRAETSRASARPDRQPVGYAVGRVRIGDGSATFTDESLPLPFTAEIAELDGEVSTLASASEEPARIDLVGRVDEYGEVRIEGAVRPAAPQQFSRVDLSFANLDMPAMSPYVIKFAGREIAQGRLDADLSYRLEDERLEGDNAIVMREFRLGERVDHPDALDLPLGLAVALLKDANGVIDLDVPVEGDLNDPQFSYGGVIRRALVNLITSAVSSPFRLLAGLVGAEGESLQDIQFVPGEHALSPPEQQKLDKLADALVQRPALRVRVPPVVAPQADRRALQAARLEALLEERLADSGATPSGEPAQRAERRRALLESLYRGANLEPPLDALRAEHTSARDPEAQPVLDRVAYTEALHEALAARQDVPDAALDQLARARAAAVIDALASETASEGSSESASSSRVATGEREEVEADDDRVPMTLEASAAE